MIVISHSFDNSRVPIPDLCFQASDSFCKHQTRQKRVTLDLSFGLPRIISEMMSIGTGNTMVELFSWEMLFRVWR